MSFWQHFLSDRLYVRGWCPGYLWLMNKNYLVGLANYNAWADAKMILCLSQVDDEQWNQPLVSSFSSIRQTAIHIASAQKIWIDFWKKTPDPVFLSATFDGSKQELLEIWKAASAGLAAFVEACPEEDYLRHVTFRYPTGREGHMEFWQTVAHVVNHTTYHRGQLVTMLRQAGYTGFSSMDMAGYYLS